jgi:hypothetical protein
MSESKPPKPRVTNQAKVLSAFVKAFGQTLFSRRPAHQSIAAQLHETPEGTSRLWAKNAKLMMEEGITLLLDELQAEVQVLDPLSPLIPEKRESFTFNIQIGRMAMDEASISNLMNRYAFPPRSPLYNLRVMLPEGGIVFDGTLRINRLMTIGLHMTCSLAVTPEGLMELVPIEIKSGSLPIDKILKFLGQDLGSFMPKGEQASMRFEEGRILIDPTSMFPAPKASGRLVHAEVTGEHLVMSYDNGAPRLTPPLLEPDAQAYIAMLGHDLLVGKITMTDACLQLLPLDPEATWVEFALPYYRAQLAQGESSLMYADEVLYRVPAVCELKTALPPGPQAALPSRSRRA